MQSFNENGKFLKINYFCIITYSKKNLFNSKLIKYLPQSI